MAITFGNTKQLRLRLGDVEPAVYLGDRLVYGRDTAVIPVEKAAIQGSSATATNYPKLQCLHISTLRGGARAQLDWQEADWAEGYRLDTIYDPNTAEAVESVDIRLGGQAGRTWAEMLKGYKEENEESSWRHTVAPGYKWEQYQTLGENGCYLESHDTRQPASWENLKTRCWTWTDRKTEHLSWAALRNGLAHAQQHVVYKPMVPTRKREAYFQLSAYAGDQQSPVLRSTIRPILSELLEDGEIPMQFRVEQDELYEIQLDAVGVTGIAETVLSLVYDPALMVLQSASTQSLYGGNATAQALSFTEILHIPGRVDFLISKQEQEGYEWSGPVSLFRFLTVGAGTANVALR